MYAIDVNYAIDSILSPTGKNVNRVFRFFLKKQVEKEKILFLLRPFTTCPIWTVPFE